MNDSGLSAKHDVGLARLFGHIVLPVLLASAGAAHGDVRLNSLFADHMVLQRDRPVAVWGRAEPGEAVAVAFAGQRRETKADDQGRWSVALEPLKASAAPAALTVKGANTVEMKDVLVGDVWLCSGQSNMEMAFRNWGKHADGSAYEVQGLDEAKAYATRRPGMIRYCKVPADKSDSPQEDAGCKPWVACTAENLDDVAAVPFFFAMQTQDYLASLAKTGIPIGVVNASWGGVSISMFAPGIGTDNPWWWTGGSSLAYNRMIAPLVPFSFKGFLWYQGCANGWSGDYQNYTQKMKGLAAAWRKAFGDETLPFYYVQLAGFKPLSEAKGGAAGDVDPMLGDRWSRLREAQRRAMAQIPNSFMAVAADIGDPADIHPTNKFDVGDRLARIAAVKTYGVPEARLAFTGPLYKGMKVQDGRIVVEFDPVGSGLMVGEKQGMKPAAPAAGAELKYFMIAGADKKFHPAKAEIQGATVVVSSPEVTAPVAVRYASQSMIDGCNLYGRNGLPAAPFRTDDWGW